MEATLTALWLPEPASFRRGACEALNEAELIAQLPALAWAEPAIALDGSPADEWLAQLPAIAACRNFKP